MTLFKTRDGKYFILDNATVIRPHTINPNEYVIEFPAMTEHERMDYCITNHEDVINLQMLLDLIHDKMIRTLKNGQD